MADYLKRGGGKARSFVQAAFEAKPKESRVLCFAQGDKWHAVEFLFRGGVGYAECGWKIESWDRLAFDVPGCAECLCELGALSPPSIDLSKTSWFVSASDPRYVPLAMPAARVYVVKEGDTLSSIAARFEVTFGALYERNEPTLRGWQLAHGARLFPSAYPNVPAGCRASYDLIYPGEPLVIPEGAK